jgi:hypothetical protein
LPPPPRHRTTRTRADYAQAAKLDTLAPHRDAADPACRHFGACGGCSLQALAYGAQLQHKVGHVAQLLSRVGQLARDAVAAACRTPVPAEQRYGYRNKVQLAFSSRVWTPQQEQQEQQEGEQQQQQQGQAHAPTAAPSSGAVAAGWGLGYLLPGSSDVVLPIQECSLAVSSRREAAAAGCWVRCSDVCGSTSA